MFFGGVNEDGDIVPFTEEDKKEAEAFRKLFPNKSKKWFNKRFNETILLDEVVELLDGVSNPVRTSIILSEKVIVDYALAKDPIELFKNALLEQVPCKLSEKGPLFLKKDVINWMKKKAETDRMFIFRLNSDFVKDYMQLHSVQIIKDESISKEDFFKQLAKDILEDIMTINIEEMRNLPFIIRGCLNFCGFKLSKDRKIYSRKDKIVSGLSYDVLRIYLKDMNLSSGKQGNLSKAHKDNIEKWLNWLKTECFCLEKYNIHKMRLEKLIKQSIFN